MKKILLTSIGIFAIFILAGCGNDGKNAKEDKEAVSEPAVEKTLPATVSTQPGSTANDEIKNIDEDLKAINDSELNSGLTDKDLGL